MSREQLDLEHDALAADAAGDGPTDQQLSTIAYLGHLLVTRLAELAQLEAQLHAARDRLRQTAEVDLPGKMLEAGLRSFQLADGTGLQVEDVLHCGISKERTAEAVAWLRSTGHDGIVKTTVAVAFGKGQAADATSADAALRRAGFTPTLADGVHPSTLKAWVKEMREAQQAADAAGEPRPEFPEELFGVYVRTVASVVDKTKKRSK